MIKNTYISKVNKKNKHTLEYISNEIFKKHTYIKLNHKIIILIEIPKGLNNNIINNLRHILIECNIKIKYAKHSILNKFLLNTFINHNMHIKAPNKDLFIVYNISNKEFNPLKFIQLMYKYQYKIINIFINNYIVNNKVAKLIITLNSVNTLYISIAYIYIYVIIALIKVIFNPILKILVCLAMVACKLL